MKELGQLHACMIRRTISKELHKNWRFNELCHDIGVGEGGVPEIVVLPPIECHYFFHAVPRGRGLLLTSRRWSGCQISFVHSAASNGFVLFLLSRSSAYVL